MNELIAFTAHSLWIFRYVESVLGRIQRREIQSRDPTDKRGATTDES